MNEENNIKDYILFIVISISVLLGYEYMFGSSVQPAVSNQQVSVSTNVSTTTDKNSEGNNSSIGEGEAIVEDFEPVREIEIKSSNLKGKITSKGSRIDEVMLQKYHESSDKASPVIDLLTTRKGKEYFVESYWTSEANNSLRLPTENTVWHVEGNDVLSPETPVTMIWDNKQGLVFKKTYTLDKNYLVHVSQHVINNSKERVKLQLHVRCCRNISSESKDKYWSFYSGPIGVFGKKLEEVGYDKIDEAKAENITFESKGGWCGITDKYWLVAVIPNQQTHVVTNYSRTANGLYSVDVSNDTIELCPEMQMNVEYNVFIGAKEINILDQYEESLGVKNLDLAIDFGYLYLLTKPMLYVLSFLQNVIGNMGLCILLLTVLLKLLLFPLANKSYRSMNRLRAFQPKIKLLQERYKDDRVKLGQEISALYKREKINPVGGCLPALLQSPILFALYKVLYISIDMRQAPFYGWISDLSMPDTAYILNLFGLIPIDLPGFLQIGIWPILMGLSMLIQQKLTPQVGDQTQAKMMMILMPILFTFMFASLPAGLVIYWTWSNLLGIIQQYAILKMDHKKI